ncbi:MAG: hypothetical protein GW802_33300 [Armatimonadetes bacterium]|nr:hypothetical protein [Armatimonadota bacterium]NCQ32229.1 hypothetical protein [Armatimonadota bacterium]
MSILAKERPDIIQGSEADGAAEERPRWLADRLQWFQGLKFGLFLHWGPYCQWGCIESWPLVEADTWARPDDLRAWVERERDLARSRRDYFALNTTFNPTQFDAAEWAKAAEYAGMKYVCFTTKHHDGFCMFDTKTTDYRVPHPDCPFHADPRANIAKGVFDAFRARDFGVSCYFSKSDWHSPYYWSPDFPNPDRNVNYDPTQHPDLWEQFVRFVHAQIEELMTASGPIDALWLDGGQVRPPAPLARPGVVPLRGSDIHLLGAPNPLPWRSGDGHAEVTLPEQLPCEHAWVLRFPHSRADSPQH